jgi:hypothetical protein
MTFFDFVFLGSFLLCITLVARALYLLVRRRWRRAARTAIILLGFIGAYMSVLVITSFLSSPTYAPLGTEFRFDDWSFAVVDSRRVLTLDDGRTHSNGVFQLVTVRVSNRGRGRPQREKNVTVYLLDSVGRRYEVSPSAQAALDASRRGGQPLDSIVNAGSSIQRTVVFDVPLEATDLGAVVRHGNGPRIIIGSSGSYLHAPVVTRLGMPK